MGITAGSASSASGVRSRIVEADEPCARRGAAREAQVLRGAADRALPGAADRMLPGAAARTACGSADRAPLVGADRALRVQIVGWDNGVGLARDARLLAGALAAADVEVAVLMVPGDRVGRRDRPPLVWFRRARDRARALLGGGPAFDVNVMIERIRPRFLRAARVNVLLPNPEWFKDSDAAHFSEIDAVLVKTRCAATAFMGLGKPVRYLGFTSPDRIEAGVPRERAFFHLAGKSEAKGTAALLEAWHAHPEWPRLTVVQNPAKASARATAPNVEHIVAYLPDDELRRLQNRHAFHLCPSETEGFGHYIVEAMSVGATTLTLDAPPMNELVTEGRGLLIPCAGAGRQRLATTFRADAAGIQEGVERALALDEAERRAIGRRARAWFEENDRAFRARAEGVLRAAFAAAARR